MAIVCEAKKAKNPVEGQRINPPTKKETEKPFWSRRGVYVASVSDGRANATRGQLRKRVAEVSQN